MHEEELHVFICAITKKFIFMPLGISSAQFLAQVELFAHHLRQLQETQKHRKSGWTKRNIR